MKILKSSKFLLTAVSALILTACSSSNGIMNSAESNLEKKVETSLNETIAKTERILQELDDVSKGKIVEQKPTRKSPIDLTVATRDANKKVIVAKDGTQVDSSKKVVVAEKGIDPQSSKGKEIVLSTLDQKINLNWNGEASNLISSLSKKIGFKFVEVGEKKSIKVAVSAKNKTIKEVLSLIDAQTKDKADIKVTSTTKTIEVSYK